MIPFPIALAIIFVVSTLVAFAASYAVTSLGDACHRPRGHRGSGEWADWSRVRIPSGSAVKPPVDWERVGLPRQHWRRADRPLWPDDELREAER